MLNLRFTDMKEEKEVINEPTIMGRWRKIKAEGGVGTNSEFAVLHAGKSRRHAVIVKVFNRGPNSRQQLELTVALSKESIPDSGIQTCYGLKECLNRRPRSILLRMKTIAGLSAGGKSSLCLGGISGVDGSGDVDDRFVISVHPRLLEADATTEFQEPEGYAWIVFDSLCQKSPNFFLYVRADEEINRDPVVLDVIRPTSVVEILTSSSLLSFGSASLSQNIREELPVPPRREYVWRDHGLVFGDDRTQDHYGTRYESFAYSPIDSVGRAKSAPLS
ncbi:hypothetical protein B0H14DRAFT_2571818 [Mycena olivaceomarginata]|nr:hypothetical protein B0H14DRAFT_2571818 [Mycena olivaceomarginata]